VILSLLDPPSEPSSASKPSPTAFDKFRRLKIITEPPLGVSKPESYQALQNQPDQRIWDDRPEADRFIPPISLLYDGFGIFDDVLCGRGPVPGESDILEVKLWDEVDTFADQMAKFYGGEAGRRGTVIYHLQRIFRARRDPHAVRGNITPSRIGSRQIVSDGHLLGGHGAIMFCIECENELSGISCEPSAKLVSCVASSFIGQWGGDYKDLFDGWRVPALGMTQIGERNQARVVCISLLDL
jgi:hypothetical protein